jgi:hypothetical protein
MQPPVLVAKFVSEMINASQEPERGVAKGSEVSVELLRNDSNLRFAA